MANDCWDAWAAGIIDGEGCIFFGKRSRSDRPNAVRYAGYQPGLSVAMTHELTIRKLQEMFGGSVSYRKEMRPNRKGSWAWVVSARKAASTIERVRPWLVTKAEQADTFLEYQSGIHRYIGRDGVPLDEIERRESLVIRMKFLNRRGPEPIYA